MLSYFLVINNHGQHCFLKIYNKKTSKLRTLTELALCGSEQNLGFIREVHISYDFIDHDAVFVFYFDIGRCGVL